MEPRYQLDKDSICYGCQHFKAVEDCDNEPYSDNMQCGEVCDCEEPCFAGSLNENKDNYYNQFRKEMKSAGIVESDIAAAISVIKKLRNEN